MTTEINDPQFVAGERTALRQWLDYHRAVLARKCEGLTDEQLRLRAVEPSSLSLLGLVRHMALVETSWFQNRFAGGDVPLPYISDGNPDGEFDDVDGADVVEAFTRWREACDRSREIEAAAKSLDETGVVRGESVDLRWIMIHMIEEYARHNGHADFLRERIDGRTGD
ncbi:DinB family protein [Bailinhaonella thermotolerans]|uniref:DinB family protein n=1 Tax=Bailinhaonella thermotolerans TaxID=1070861 RepID=A0A3A4A250_9ACTN|nr:DinB family protein [Bailinhaonella thermotolerans]RJL22746.1 DinB family protein [Bailinhaonella thermotolerans]